MLRRWVPMSNVWSHEKTLTRCIDEPSEKHQRIFGDASGNIRGLFGATSAFGSGHDNLFIGFRNYIVNTWFQSHTPSHAFTFNGLLYSAHVIMGDQSEKKISNAQRSIAVAPPMLRRSSSGTSASIGDGSRNHRRYLSYRKCIAVVYTSIADVSPMCRRCVADVSGTCLTLVHIAECSPTARRCSAIYRRWYLASKHQEKISMHALKFSRCPDALAKHGDYSRTSPIIRRTTGAWWRCPGDAQICASREHREA